jgi:pimeloyl-ACP methyl ester carboxylesterase
MDDELIPSRYGKEYARALPDARLETIDDCGHRICIDQPEKIVELIASFSSNVPTTEAGHARLAV